MPEKVTSEEAIGLFKASHKGPINCLNVKYFTLNAHPDFVVQNGYPLSMTGQNIGRDAPDGFDNPKNSSLSVLINARTHTEPHHHGISTCTFFHEGEKLWTCWIGLKIQDLEAWVRSGTDYPPNPDSLHAAQGSMLSQPPGTLHAPTSGKNVAMVGTSYIYEHQIKLCLELSILEMKISHLTNEDSPIGYLE